MSESIKTKFHSSMTFRHSTTESPSAVRVEVEMFRPDEWSIIEFETSRQASRFEEWWEHGGGRIAFQQFMEAHG